MCHHEEKITNKQIFSNAKKITYKKMNVINAQKIFTKCELFSIIWQFRLDHPLNQTYIKLQTSFGSLKKD